MDGFCVAPNKIETNNRYDDETLFACDRLLLVDRISSIVGDIVDPDLNYTDEFVAKEEGREKEVGGGGGEKRR